jgi:hypothetical protein
MTMHLYPEYLFLKIPNVYGVTGVDQVVEHLPSKDEILSSNQDAAH